MYTTLSLLGHHSLNSGLSASTNINCGFYRIRSLFGGDFNLVVWRFFVHPPNLNDANIVL